MVQEIAEFSLIHSRLQENFQEAYPAEDLSLRDTYNARFHHRLFFFFLIKAINSPKLFMSLEST